MYLSLILTDQRTQPKLPRRDPPLTSYLSQLASQIPHAQATLQNDRKINPHYLHRVVLMVELYDLMKWLDACRPYTTEKDFDLVLILQNRAETALRSDQEQNKDQQINFLILQDHILTQISNFLKLNPWDCLSQLPEFFKDRDFTLLLIDLSAAFFPYMSLYGKSVFLSLLFYGLLSMKVYMGTEEVDHRLAEFFGKQILDLVEERSFNQCGESYCLQVLSTYLSAISNKDWLKSCFGDTNLIDEAIFRSNPFYYDNEELFSEFFVAHRWALVPLMKRLADSVMPGTSAFMQNSTG